MKKSIFLFFSLFLFFSCYTKKQAVSNNSKNLSWGNTAISRSGMSIDSNEVFTVVEVMPGISSCGENDNYNRTGSCTNRKLANFIYENLKYPDIGKKFKITGIVAIKFVVNSDGSINDIGVKCNKISGTEEVRKAFADEAVRVIEKMKTSNLKWTAGKQAGRNINALYYYPVMFRYNQKK